MSNVLEFRSRTPSPPPGTPVAYTVYATIDLDADGYLITCRCQGENANDLPPSFASVDSFVGRALWQSAWPFFRDHARKDQEDPEAVTLLAAISRGSRVTVYSPDENHPDAYEGEARMAWLKRRLNEIHDLAPPWWSEEQPASGMTSSSHSANIDQLEFSW